MSSPPSSSAIEEKAKRVWDIAEETLRQLDNAHIFSVAKQTCRDFPTFDANEIISGPLLGKGGFSNVFEIIDIQLQSQTPQSDHDKKEESPQNIDNNNKNENNSKGDSPKSKGKQSLAFETAAQTTTEENRKEDQEEDHYDVDTARELMSKRCMRFGAARYAIKRLRPDLNKLEYARGALDLAIEIKYMGVLMHPNIVKMRAFSNTPRLSLDTFIVMDRLYGTLEEKMQAWIQADAMLQGCCGMSKDSEAQKQLLIERLLVAYDLTVALAHMHSLRLIYRDIKPDNIGFDVRGDVKVFDFGLVKSLDDNLKATQGAYGYKLTSFTGSIPYMAPEIALKEPYDKEADVFSFSMLLWEILSMEVMYPSYTIKDYFVRVCKQNERPPIPSNKSWPPVMKAVVQEGWDRNPQKRPTMKRVGMLIRGLLSDMSSGDDGIVNRSTHMMDKSRRSLHNNLVTGDDPMMDSSSGRRRAGRRSDRASGLGTNTTGKASAGVHASGRMRESFHQNFDTSELD